MIRGGSSSLSILTYSKNIKVLMNYKKLIAQIQCSSFFVDFLVSFFIFQSTTISPSLKQIETWNGILFSKETQLNEIGIYLEFAVPFFLTSTFDRCWVVFASDWFKWFPSTLESHSCTVVFGEGGIQIRKMVMAFPKTSQLRLCKLSPLIRNDIF